ncbi:hypothetical protein ACOME3_008309 [Neoechinorhynchus agilis]
MPKDKSTVDSDDIEAISTNSKNSYMLVRNRERRLNAGNKMKTLVRKCKKELRSTRRRIRNSPKIENSDEKDVLAEYFDKQVGDIEVDDHEFLLSGSSSDESESDSDINDVQNALLEQEDKDADEDDEKRPKKRTLVSKVQKAKSQKHVAETSSLLTPRRSIRETTARKRIERVEREQRSSTSKTASLRLTRRRLTQEELLEEAKITAEINTLSLHKYASLDPDQLLNCLIKKKTDRFTEVYKKADNLSSGVITHMKLVPIEGTHTSELQTTLTFTDDQSFRKWFPIQKLCLKRQKRICPVTGKLARYVDPLTNVAYYDSNAFKIIREVYERKMCVRKEEKMDMTD